MITELASQEKVVGVKQSRKAIREVTDPIAASCAQAGIPVETGYTLTQLGQACRISVGAAVVALLTP